MPLVTLAPDDASAQSVSDAVFTFHVADTRIPPGVSVRTVAVAGSFNGWSKDQNMMKETKPGVFSATLSLNPGLHYYKYVVNGDIWLYDAASDPALLKPDGFEGFNSGIEVKQMAYTERKKSAPAPVKDVPEWAREVVWYQIFPERFRNGDPNNDPKLADIREDDIPGWRVTPWGSDWYAMDEWEKNKYGKVFQAIFRRRYGGDLQGVLDKLDYLQDLGVTAIYLNPIFRAPSLHKYDGASLHHVEETFGPDPEGDRKMIAGAKETTDPKTWVWTSADRLFLKLVKEVHRRKMRIIIDGVFNHTGREFFAFQDILKNGNASPYTGWYRIKRWDKSLPDGFEYQGWFGVHSLPELNRSDNDLAPPVKEYIFNITSRWLQPEGKIENGVDGWRLDVAFCVPHGFWKDWRKHVKSINRDAYITGEVVEPAPDFLEGDEFDALMNYPFAYSAIEFFADQKNKIAAAEFDRRLRELRNIYPPEITAVMQNLISSHDVARMRTLIVNPDMNYRDFGGHFQKSKIENNPAYRIDRGSAEHRAVHKLIAAFQMTYPGAPMIYYGDEVGMTGANDPDCRKPMLWDDITYQDEKAHPFKDHARPLEKNAPDTELLGHYRKLIQIRNQTPALRLGSYETLLANDAEDVFVFARIWKKQTAIVALNNGAGTQTVSIPLPEKYPATFADAFGPGTPVKAIAGVLKLTLPPKGAAILVNQ